MAENAFGTVAAQGRAWVRRLIGTRPAATLERYVTATPSLQNAIDATPGWIGAMPPQTGLVAGAAPLFADTRIAWLLEHFAIAGRRVLELGPLEGSHTYMLHEAGAAHVDAIEANTLAFMRCLIAREALGLSRARFLLGDFMPWLEMEDLAYDLVVASGVLYHSTDPVRLLQLVARRAEAVYLWTHYFDEAAMRDDDPRRRPFSGRLQRRECAGVTLRLHERTYRGAWRDPKFCGGTHDRHYWLERQGILDLLAALGFGRILLGDDLADHHYGPCISIFATRASC